MKRVEESPGAVICPLPHIPYILILEIIHEPYSSSQWHLHCFRFDQMHANCKVHLDMSHGIYAIYINLKKYAINYTSKQCSKNNVFCQQKPLSWQKQFLNIYSAVEPGQEFCLDSIAGEFWGNHLYKRFFHYSNTMWLPGSMNP